MGQYIINYSDPAKNENNNYIVVVDGTENKESTSLTFVGRNWPSYGQAIGENFLRLLENFSNSSPPKNPIEGQLWFDTSNVEKKVLRVNDGSATTSQWVPINGIYQQGDEPLNSKQGDIWVNTDAQQLSIYNGAEWILVGPSFNGSTLTGSYATTLQDTLGGYHSVIINYVDNAPLEILATDTFSPNPVINGYTILRPGINVTTANVGVLTPQPARINATAAYAFGLKSSTYGTTFDADTVLRNDIDQTMQGTLTVSNDNGITIGENGSIVIKKNPVRYYANLLTNPINSGTWEFSVAARDIMKLSTGTSIIYSELNLQKKVSFSNTASFSGAISVASTSTFASNLNINSNLLVSGAVNITSGPIILGSTSSVNTEALTPAVTEKYDLGAVDKRFQRMFIGQIYADSVTADVIGTTTRLRTPTTWRVFGDVNTNQIAFDGTSNVELHSTLTAAAFTSKTVLANTTASDSILVYRGSDNTIYKQTKQEFLRDIGYTQLSIVTPSPGNLVPAGTIIPYAGTEVTIPTAWGWVLCDGSSYLTLQARYARLFSIIGHTYGGAGNQFEVPNLAPLMTVDGKEIRYIIKL